MAHKYNCYQGAYTKIKLTAIWNSNAFNSKNFCWDKKIFRVITDFLEKVKINGNARYN